mgnify:CR=1 FL=1
MKLYMLRHGDAEIRSLTGKDFDRRLSENGRRQANIVKTKLQLITENEPFTVYCSTAKRAEETYFIASLALKVKSLEFSDKLYLALLEGLIEFFRNIEPVTQSVLLVGHNEGISQFASYLLDEELVFPTAGLLEVSFPIIDEWKYIGRGTGAEVNRFFNSY